MQSFEQYKSTVNQADFSYKHFLFYKKLDYTTHQISPIDVYQKINRDDSALLESKAPGVGRYRFTFIGYEPQIDIEIYKDHYCLNDNKKKVRESFNPEELGKPLDFINKNFDDQLAYSDVYFSGFIGGLFGFFTYDSFRFFENIPDSHPKKTQEPEIYLAKYNKFIVYDYEEDSIYIATSQKISEDLHNDFLEAQNDLEEIQSYFNLEYFKRIEYYPTNEFVKCDSELSDADYGKIIQQGREFCHAGDIFQVVLSRKFFYPITNPKIDSFALYRTLRKVSPAPYMFYFKIKGETYIGASPEQLIRVFDNVASVTPLAGTRAIHNDSNIEQLRQDLINDPKELAEHLMLVDLGRNDLGAVCQAGSVKVLEFSVIKEFAHIMHISSEVEGILAPQFNCFDALAKVFPAGTLSGAPKIRAMEIIDQLEVSRRGMYAGGIFTVNHTKDMLTCIAIRMAHYKDDLVTVQCGAGVVYDSVIENEVLESWNKAQSVLKAIYVANEGRIKI